MTYTFGTWLDLLVAATARERPDLWRGFSWWLRDEADDPVAAEWALWMQWKWPSQLTLETGEKKNIHGWVRRDDFHDHGEAVLPPRVWNNLDGGTDDDGFCWHDYDSQPEAILECLGAFRRTWEEGWWPKKRRTTK